MRQERTVQASIFDLFADHEIGRELKEMSQDGHRELIGLAAEDLRRRGIKETGRWGLPAEVSDSQSKARGQPLERPGHASLTPHSAGELPISRARRAVQLLFLIAYLQIGAPIKFANWGSDYVGTGESRDGTMELWGLISTAYK